MPFAAAKYSADLIASTLTDITNGGVAVGGSYVLAVANRTNSVVSISIAITTGGVPVNADYIEYNTTLDSAGTGGINRNWPIPLSQGWRVYMQSTISGVSATLLGAVS